MTLLVAESACTVSGIVSLYSRPCNDANSHLLEEPELSKKVEANANQKLSTVAAVQGSPDWCWARTA